MSIGILDAVSAYGRAVKAQRSDASAPDKVAETSFGSVIGNMVAEAAGNMRAAEEASARQLAGKGDLIDVVTAVGAAETALDTVVAVRDRVVSAYSEIMRMQI